MKGYIQDRGAAAKVIKALQRRGEGAQMLRGDEIAAMTGIKEQSVPSSMAAAVRAGFLRKERGTYKGNSIMLYSLGAGQADDDAVEAAAGDDTPAPFNCALWLDGDLALQRGDDVIAVLTRAETDQLADYLSRAWRPQLRAITELLPPPPAGNGSSN